MDSSLLIALAPAAIVAVVGYLIHRHIVGKGTITEIVHYAELAVRAAEEAHASGVDSGIIKYEQAAGALIEKFGVSEKEAETFVLGALQALRQAGYLDKKEA